MGNNVDGASPRGPVYHLGLPRHFYCVFNAIGSHWGLGIGMVVDENYVIKSSSVTVCSNKIVGVRVEAWWDS